MKKFITLFVIFSIGLLILFFILDWMVTAELRKSQTRMLVGWNDIYSKELKNDILIIGNSRAWLQYNPIILDSILHVNSYNLGINGGAINRQIIKYNTYRRLNVKPKFIIQNIDYLTLDIVSGFEKNQFFPYFFDKTLIKEVSVYEKFNVMDKYIPFYRYRSDRHDILLGLGISKTRRLQHETLLVKGYEGREKSWDGSKFEKQEKLNYLQNTTAIDLFTNYLAQAKKENIKVIFVYAPHYIGATQKIQNIEGMYLMYDSIAKKYNIPILDYNYHPISYDTSYFYNAMHLNKVGAELFSKKLAFDIDSLGLIK